MAQLLEDFNGTIRNNSEGDMLFDAYSSEDPGSSAAVVNGSLRLTGSATTGKSIYMDFLPITASFYPYPSGFAQHYIKSGTWDADNNRLSFIFRCDTADARRSDGGNTLQIGTYVKNKDHADNQEQGRHFYHHFDINIYADKWAKIWVNRHPQHERSALPGINWPENPTTIVAGVNTSAVNYFDGLNRFYFDPQGGGLESSLWDFDDFYFSKVSGEPDYDISSICALYTGTQYEVTWAGEKNTDPIVTYEIRYKTTSMKTAGFATGTDGSTTTNPGNDYEGCIWQSGAMAENAAGMYIAIRVQGDTDFTEIYLPYQLGPGNSGDEEGGGEPEPEPSTKFVLGVFN